jgi:hypothetical protein
MPARLLISSSVIFSTSINSRIISRSIVVACSRGTLSFLALPICGILLSTNVCTKARDTQVTRQAQAFPFMCGQLSTVESFTAAGSQVEGWHNFLIRNTDFRAKAASQRIKDASLRGSRGSCNVRGTATLFLRLTTSGSLRDMLCDIVRGTPLKSKNMEALRGWRRADRGPSRLRFLSDISTARRQLHRPFLSRVIRVRALNFRSN